MAKIFPFDMPTYFSNSQRAYSTNMFLLPGYAKVNDNSWFCDTNVIRSLHTWFCLKDIGLLTN